MDLNNNCCNTDNLKEIIELEHSEIKQISLFQCSNCKTHWLYIKNIELNNIYKIWYMKVHSEDVINIISNSFNNIKFKNDYIYISNITNELFF